MSISTVMTVLRTVGRPLQRLRGDQRGSIAVLMAVMLVPSVGLGALIVDGSRMRTAHLEIQIVAEAAALAAAQNLPSVDDAREAATDYAEANLDPTKYGNVVRSTDVEFGTYDDSNGTFSVGGTTAVRVTAGRTEDRSNAFSTLFGGVIGRPSVDLTASAIAVAETSGGNPICILVLGFGYYGLDMDGDINVDIPDCGIQVNSDDDDAMNSKDDSYVNAAYIHVVGEVDGDTDMLNPQPVEGVDPVADPYASLAAPTLKPCGGTDEIDGGTHTLVDTYRFCDGLEIDDATVTFSPGEYQISGDFDLKGTANISGTDVTIYVEGDHSRIYFRRDTSFALSAPTTGPYAGIVMWSSRDNDESHEFYSNFGSSSSGSFYFPAAKMDIEDDAVWHTDCLRIVAWILDFSPDSTFSASSPATNCENNIYAKPSGVRLVR
ncbi:hypothetical protein PB2503_06977 [Parvularcula bermudensis HTCC2503]|uniref:Putative Flp pilus-assembly TadG-like N-terminal domain-containing protein n=1 Tax=Parvularcula bermudensis (strain ATCC BAA-594 / HTCC2503 / KCTC 12087) TaxID=314260 RepID=E0TE86_PARBH|nr:pilus assembly protein TadG-related protein [Parvularcula bermudensis]ADM09461.1 hypothetical protein PB2503_06977 [Parvularcula bermudensis HTCC2503]